jgi:hypothetical protein
VNEPAASAVPLRNLDAALVNRAHRLLAVALWILGAVDMLALVVPLLSDAVIAWCHRQLGLGTIPTEPIVGYLARSASIMYALHGLVVIYVSFDLPRYWPLIRVLGIAAVIHGGLMIVIDVRVGMPGWWTLLEGPCFAGTGVAALILQRIAGPPDGAPP